MILFLWKFSLIFQVGKNFLLFLTTDSTEFLRGKTNDYKLRSLKKPNPFTAAQLRAAELKETLKVLPEKDQQFVYERIKENQHLERLFASLLQVIRQYDFLPKSRLVSSFQRSMDYVYFSNYEAKENLKEEEN